MGCQIVDYVKGYVVVFLPFRGGTIPDEKESQFKFLERLPSSKLARS